MDIVEATRAYEIWLGRHIAIVKDDLEAKHRKMGKGAFEFLRATFYRWAQVWPALCPELADAPSLLAVGDLHVENFGTWRDAEGRLVWGLNDVDEAAPMPYAIDLVRLAASAVVAAREDHLTVAPADACDAILAGYTAGIKQGGAPFVLEESHPALRAMALSADRAPAAFWARLTRPKPMRDVPPAMRRLLARYLPEPKLDFRVVRRRSGLGSLGRPRFVALAALDGGWVAREAKAILPSACFWAAGRPAKRLHGAALLARAVRCPDPYVFFTPQWQVRRLAPHCSRIALAELDARRDERRLLGAMGRETANIHRGTPAARRAVLRDLARRKDTWLLKAAQRMADTLVEDWQTWRKHLRALLE